MSDSFAIPDVPAELVRRSLTANLNVISRIQGDGGGVFGRNSRMFFENRRFVCVGGGPDEYAQSFCTKVCRGRKLPKFVKKMKVGEGIVMERGKMPEKVFFGKR